MHKLFWTLKVFFLFFNSFYLKNDLFSLFYSGPFVNVKSDDMVCLKESQCLVHTLGKNVGKQNKLITLFQSDIKAGNGFDVVPSFAQLWCRWDAI